MDTVAVVLGIVGVLLIVLALRGLWLLLLEALCAPEKPAPWNPGRDDLSERRWALEKQRERERARELREGPFIRGDRVWNIPAPHASHAPSPVDHHHV